MGTVHAREHDKMSREVKEQAAREGGVQVSLDAIPAQVAKVHVEGVNRTNEKLIFDHVRPILKVTQFNELVLTAQDIRNRLQSLGCFSEVDIHLDTAKNGGKRDYEVTFTVKEMNRIIGSVNTLVGNQEASLMLGAKLPNLLGRGERFNIDYTHGSKQTKNFNIGFSKPIHSMGCKESGLPNTYSIPTFTSYCFQNSGEVPSSGYKEILRGAILDLSFLSAPQVAHNLQWEGVWRELSCIDRLTTFPVREHSGHTLKSAMKHILTVDRRDDPIFPSDGTLLKLYQEYAGLGGDVEFLKNEIELQGNFPLWTTQDQETGESYADVVLQGTFNCGHLKRFGNPNKIVSISDQFFLGGPLNVRGFETRGLGPSCRSNALGGVMYWAGGLHLYTPLPFRRRKGAFGEIFRTHFFVNAGNLLAKEGSFRESCDLALQNFRLSCGVGLALKLGGVARVELNYCIPIRSLRGDRPEPGLKIGVGVNFL